MAKKLLSSKSNYVPKRMINELEVERNGKTTYIDGADIYDGMYVKKGVKYAKGSTVKGGNIQNWLVEYLSPKGRKQLKEFSSESSAMRFGENKSTETGVEGVELIKFHNNRMYKVGHFRNGKYVEQVILAKGGGLSNSKYIPNRMVQSVEVERKGKTTDIDGADIYDGFYVKKGVKFAEGGNMEGWGGTSESSQDGMLIGGTNAELTSNQYRHGGSMEKNSFYIFGKPENGKPMLSKAFTTIEGLATYINKTYGLSEVGIYDSPSYGEIKREAGIVMGWAFANSNRDKAVEELSKKHKLHWDTMKYEHGGSMGGWCYEIGGL